MTSFHSLATELQWDILQLTLDYGPKHCGEFPSYTKQLKTIIDISATWARCAFDCPAIWSFVCLPACPSDSKFPFLPSHNLEAIDCGVSRNVQMACSRGSKVLTLFMHDMSWPFSDDYNASKDLATRNGLMYICKHQRSLKKLIIRTNRPHVTVPMICGMTAPSLVHSVETLVVQDPCLTGWDEHQASQHLSALAGQMERLHSIQVPFEVLHAIAPLLCERSPLGILTITDVITWSGLAFVLHCLPPPSALAVRVQDFRKERRRMIADSLTGSPLYENHRDYCLDRIQVQLIISPQNQREELEPALKFMCHYISLVVRQRGLTTLTLLLDNMDGWMVPPSPMRVTTKGANELVQLRESAKIVSSTPTLSVQTLNLQVLVVKELDFLSINRTLNPSNRCLGVVRIQVARKTDLQSIMAQIRNGFRCSLVQVVFPAAPGGMWFDSHDQDALYELVGYGEHSLKGEALAVIFELKAELYRSKCKLELYQTVVLECEVFEEPLVLPT